MATIQGVGQNGKHILAQVKFSTNKKTRLTSRNLRIQRTKGEPKFSKIQNTLNITIVCTLIFSRFNCHLVRELK
jgi:hypothetical protein